MLLKIAFFAAAVSFVSLFFNDKVNNVHLYVSLALIAVYEVLFVVYHHLVGILT